jgi:hypothetical protein
MPKVTNRASRKDSVEAMKDVRAFKKRQSKQLRQRMRCVGEFSAKNRIYIMQAEARSLRSILSPRQEVERERLRKLNSYTPE